MVAFPDLARPAHNTRLVVRLVALISSGMNEADLSNDFELLHPVKQAQAEHRQFSRSSERIIEAE